MSTPDLNKLLKRGWMVLQAFIKNYSSPLFNAVLAWVVIRYYHAGLWGDFVKVQLFVMLSSQFCNWSSKTQLLRSFSSSPATMHSEWKRSYSERLPLLLLIIPLAFFFLDGGELIALSIVWLFARYIILSFEPVILYERLYFIGILSDLLSFVIALLAVLFIDGLKIENIVAIIAAAELCEAIVLSILFRKSFRILHPKSFRGVFLKESAWLFLLAFSAFAGMRADLLCAAFYLEKEELAFYQVLVNFLLGLQSLSNILIMPYMQNYFRMSSERIFKAASKLLLYGIIICITASPVIIAIINYVYRLPVEPVHVLLAIAYALPVFYYTLFSYILLKKKHDRDVFLINIAGVTANVLLAIFLLPVLGVTGGILAASISHFLLMVLYYFRVRRLLRSEVHLPIADSAR